jgi:peptidoglycan/LPS O-acetylase OafA/YrhL
MKKYYKDINTLRGAAALSVVCYHYFYHYFNVYQINGGYKLFAIGKYGVDIFFMISGFLIYPLIKKSTDWWGFLRERFIRLYPIYSIAVLLTFIIVILSGDNVRAVSFYDLLKNLLMFPSLLGGKFVDGSYWTLEIEWQFYFYSIFIMFLYKIKADKLMMLSLLFFILCSNKTIALGGYYSYFYIGIYTYLIKIDKINFKVNFIGLFVSIIITLITAKYLIITSMVLLLFIVLSLSDENLLPNSRILNFFAYISYPLYLIHQNIGYVLINNLKSYIGMPLSYLVTILMVVTMSYLIVVIYNKATNHLR